MNYATWLVVGVPYAAVMLPATWGLLLVTLGRNAGRLQRTDVAEEDPGGSRTRLGKVMAGIAFAAAAIMWTTRGLWAHVPVPAVQRAGESLDDTLVALGCGLALFVLPARIRPLAPVIGWADARRIEWGVLVLFGGGIALGRGLMDSGAAAWIAGHLAFLSALPLPVTLGCIVLLVLVVTELTSNTASAAMLVPLLFSLARTIGVDPWLLAVPATVACSGAFMLPVATPPNAIVFASGRLRIRDMALLGSVLNLLALAVVVALALLVWGPLLGPHR